MFLLVHVAGLRPCASRDAWIAAARDRRTIAAQSLNFPKTADGLVSYGLATTNGTVSIRHPLAGLGQSADFGTLKAIAIVLMCSRPPIWLRQAIIGGVVHRELIPTSDLHSLSWLGPDLDEVLIAVHSERFASCDDEFASKIGLAGELIIVSALTKKRIPFRHLSLISDAYGYDIECDTNNNSDAIEVKTSVTKTASRFFLSRNEFEVSKRLGPRWKVLQVVLSSRVVATGVIKPEDIEIIRELSSESLLSLAPSNEHEFRWVESAIFVPRENDWRKSDLSVPDDFSLILNSLS